MGDLPNDDWQKYTGWNRYEALVLSEIKGLREGHTQILSGLHEVKTEIAVLKVRAAI